MKTTLNTFSKVCMVSRCASAVSLYFFILSTHIDERCLGYVFSTSYTVDGNTTKKQYMIDTVSPIPLVIFSHFQISKIRMSKYWIFKSYPSYYFHFFHKVTCYTKIPVSNLLWCVDNKTV